MRQSDMPVFRDELNRGNLTTESTENTENSGQKSRMNSSSSPSVVSVLSVVKSAPPVRTPAEILEAATLQEIRYQRARWRRPRWRQPIAGHDSWFGGHTGLRIYRLPDADLFLR